MPTQNGGPLASDFHSVFTDAADKKKKEKKDNFL